MMLLMLTQTLAKEDTKKWRITLGALVASLLVPISLYFPDSIFTTLIGKVVFSILIIICTFRFHSIYQMVKLLLLFYFTTFAIGGGLIALHFLLQHPISMSSSGILTFNSGYGDSVSWLFVMIGFPIVWLFTKRRMDKHVAEKIRYDQLCPVTIQVGNKSYSTTGYIDSGNQLVDPVSKKFVIICDESFLKHWFTDKDWNCLKKAHDELRYEEIPLAWKNRIHLIPYHGVEGNSTFMMALKADQLIVYHDQNKLITTKFFIGIQFGQLTRDQRYHCLLHPQIIHVATVSSA